MSAKEPFKPSEPYGTYVLVILSVLGTFGGFASLSNATMGVGILACCCELAIFARIAQSGKQHADIMRAMQERNTPTV